MIRYIPIMLRDKRLSHIQVTCQSCAGIGYMESQDCLEESRGDLFIFRGIELQGVPG